MSTYRDECEKLYVEHKELKKLFHEAVKIMSCHQSKLMSVFYKEFIDREDVKNVFKETENKKWKKREWMK